MNPSAAVKPGLMGTLQSDVRRTLNLVCLITSWMFTEDSDMNLKEKDVVWGDGTYLESSNDQQSVYIVLSHLLGYFVCVLRRKCSTEGGRGIRKNTESFKLLKNRNFLRT